MIVRNATVDDARRIAEIKVAGWRAAYRGVMPDDVLDQLSVKEQAARWRRRISDHPGRVLVAVTNGTVSGYVSAAASRDEDPPDPIIGEIYALYVHPDHWRCGIGSALIAAGLETLRRQSFRQVTLWVLADNGPAIGFYRTHGFQPDGRSKLETFGGVSLREIALARAL
ncbi:MAG: GNAT family N-acetyltransferase [Caldilineales bacterium]